MKILYLSDFNARGSGYKTISMPLCKGLVEHGNEVRAIGLDYKGEEHTFPYSIIPCNDFREAVAMIHNLKRLWQPDIIVAAMDIPWHEEVITNVKRDQIQIPYIGIMPLESDPLCIDWAMVMMQMEATLIISEFGTEESKKQGVNAEYLPIGIDMASWRPPSVEEKLAVRKALQLDGYVILTVAENQERKNLNRGMEI
jgi:hypothetical protein